MLLLMSVSLHESIMVVSWRALEWETSIAGGLRRFWFCKETVVRSVPEK